MLCIRLYAVITVDCGQLCSVYCCLLSVMQTTVFNAAVHHCALWTTVFNTAV